MSDEFIENIVDKALLEFNDKNKNKDTISKLECDLLNVKDQISKFTDLLIQSRNIDLIMDKIDLLKKEEKDLEEKIFDAKSKDIKVDRNDLIKRIKKIRDFEITNSNTLQKFVDMFIYRIYVNKDKKIAVLIKLSDGNIQSECSDNSPLVE